MPWYQCDASVMVKRGSIRYLRVVGLDADRVPASYRTFITRGLVHYVDCG